MLSPRQVGRATFVSCDLFHSPSVSPYCLLDRLTCWMLWASASYIGDAPLSCAGSLIHNDEEWIIGETTVLRVICISDKNVNRGAWSTDGIKYTSINSKPTTARI